MIRIIVDGSEAANYFGTGYHGYAPGLPFAAAATIVKHHEVNTIQEELARAVRGSGQTVIVYANEAAATAAHAADTLPYNQLDVGIRSSAAQVVCQTHNDANHVIEGFGFDDVGFPDFEITSGGSFVDGGRLYNITEPQLVATGSQAFTLALNSDNWFFISKHEPAAPLVAGVLTDEDTVHVVMLSVATNVARPATPAGYMPLARLRTDGVALLSTVYYGSGPALTVDEGVGVQLTGDDTTASLAPVRGASVLLGAATDPAAVDADVLQGRYYSAVHANALVQQPAVWDADNPRAQRRVLLSRHTLAVGASATINLTAGEDYRIGASMVIKITAVAHCPGELAATYAATQEHSGRRVSGTQWQPTELTSLSHTGPTAIAANMRMAVSNFLQTDVSVTLVGHDTQISEWHLCLEILTIGPAVDDT